MTGWDRVLTNSDVAAITLAVIFVHCCELILDNHDQILYHLCIPFLLPGDGTWK